MICKKCLQLINTIVDTLKKVSSTSGDIDAAILAAENLVVVLKTYKRSC